MGLYPELEVTSNEDCKFTQFIPVYKNKWHKSYQQKPLQQFECQSADFCCPEEWMGK